MTITLWMELKLTCTGFFFNEMAPGGSFESLAPSDLSRDPFLRIDPTHLDFLGKANRELEKFNSLSNLLLALCRMFGINDIFG